MKKNIFLLLSSFTALVAYAQTAGTSTSEFNNLPPKIQHFVTEHFDASTVSATIYEKEAFEAPKYKVYFTDGTKIEFVNEQWKEIKTRTTPIPGSLLNKNIADYVSKTYPTTFIKEIKKKKRGGYEVELSNGLDLEFNQQGNFVRIDD